MVNKTTGRFFLILLVAFLCVVGGDDLREINCKDEVSNLCSRSRDAHYQEKENRSNSGVDTALSVTFTIVAVIAVTIFFCLVCTCCPLYKYRNNRGTVFGPASPQPQPYIIVTQPTQNTQQIPTQQFQQPQYNGNIYLPGHAVPQTIYPPYHSDVPEQQRDPWIGHHAGIPEEPPPSYYETVPQQNQNMNNNFTIK